MKKVEKAPARDFAAEFADRHLDSILTDGRDNRVLTGISPAARAFTAASFFQQRLGSKKSGSVLCITASGREAEELASEALLFLDADRVARLPGFDAIPYEFAGISADTCRERMRLFERLRRGEPMLVFAGMEAVLRTVPDPARLSRSMIELEPGDTPKNFTHTLVSLGYARSETCELPGEFTVKGSILDVYPVNEDYGLRFDFFDDEVESIRSFSPDTQKSGDRLEKAVILSAGEIHLDAGETKKLRDMLASLPGDLAKPEWLEDPHSPVLSVMHHEGLQDLFPLVLPRASVLDWFGKEPLILLAAPDELRDAEARTRRDVHAMFEKERTVRVCAPPETLLVPESVFDLKNTVELRETEFGVEPGTSNLFQKTELRMVEGFGGRMKAARETIGGAARSGQTVVITSPYQAQLTRIASLFGRDDGVQVQTVEPPLRPPPGGGLYLVRSSHRQGFRLPELGLYLWSDNDVFGRSYRRQTRFKKAGSSPIESFLDLKEKDYVVHVNHGVGRFLALERVTAAGRERDFLVLEYADGDRLFVPLDQISMVQKYIAPVEKPRLDSLGRASFKKVRARVAEKIEEFAEELLETYAVRASQRGITFPEDTAWQEEFEADFPFEETPDQMSAIEAVKRDMESPRPMDRLVCGDVGYGKTEVAVRAAFKAVMAGRQAVVICPTTILALQHYRTFSDRYKNYPVSVEWISRFRTRGEIQAVKEKLEAGEVDVVIGTHALLAKDVKPKNLGLLVVDEEQRFGVVHKEAIKKLRRMVDVITLSATPIPRTLHMSLVGIRDLSIIQTPPRDRLPVQTYVLEDSDTVLKEAIRRELERDGQIFYLHNRIDSIDECAKRIHDLFPGIRIGVLHGQMDDDEIEDVLVDFMERRYDVLVTTAIVENGIDIPNVNTLIVDRADLFGLSQLYQIRGRVGRSNRQAYAYLFYPKGRLMTEESQKRLHAIMEYQELGSGFKVAMRDLEIRGAGNIFGREQSGHIIDVGYELYVKMLDEAVKKLQGRIQEVEVRTSINLNADFFIPEDYIKDTRQRIEFYKRFEGAGSLDEVEELAGEMEERFGKAPESASAFVETEKIRTLASRAGFESVYEEDGGRIQFKAGEHFRVPRERIVDVLKNDSRLQVMAGSADTLYFTPKSKNAAKEAVEVLLELTR